MIVRGSINSSPIRAKKPQQILRYDTPNSYLETRYKCTFTPEPKTRKDEMWSPSSNKTESPGKQVRYYVRTPPPNYKIHREIPNTLEAKVFPDKFLEKFDPFKPIESVSEMDRCISEAKNILNRSKSSCSTKPVSVSQSPEKSRSINSSRREIPNSSYIQPSIRTIENSAEALYQFSVNMQQAADVIKSTAEELKRSARKLSSGNYYNRNEYPHPWRLKR